MYIFPIIKRNHFKVIICVVSPTTPNMYILKCFRFIMTKIYNILRHSPCTTSYV